MSTPSHQDRPLMGLFMRLLSMAAISTTFMLVKYLGEQGVHVVETLFYRYMVGCVMMTAIVVFGPGWGALKTDRMGSHLYRALVGMAAMGLNFYAVTLMPMAEAATLSFAVPLMATVLSVIILSEFVGLQRWSAVVVGFIGILIAVRPEAGNYTMWGVIIGLAGAFGAAYSVILVRDLAKSESTTTIIFYYMVLAAPVLLIAALKFIGPHDAVTIGLIILMGVTGTLAMICVAESLRYASIAVAAPVDYTLFIFSAAYGYFIWGAWPARSLWFGLPLIVGSGLFITYREHKRRKLAMAQVEVEEPAPHETGMG